MRTTAFLSSGLADSTTVASWCSLYSQRVEALEDEREEGPEVLPVGEVTKMLA